jgi:hypothetical protein
VCTVVAGMCLAVLALGLVGKPVLSVGGRGIVPVVLVTGSVLCPIYDLPIPELTD